MEVDMNYLGLSWIIVDYRGLSWIIVDYRGLSWIIVDYRRPSSGNKRRLAQEI